LLLPDELPDGTEGVPEDDPDDEEDDDVVLVTHSPFSHSSEQHSPNFWQEAPSPLHTAPVPPHTPLSQSLLQHSPFDEHVLPSA
jgi:hypothetical protein